MQQHRQGLWCLAKDSVTLHKVVSLSDVTMSCPSSPREGRGRLLLCAHQRQDQEIATPSINGGLCWLILKYIPL